MKEVSKKILEKYFEDVKKGIKTFEVRKDEDDIQVGDILLLEEWKEGDIFTSGYTGRCIRKRVKYVLRDIPQYGLQEGYCIIGLEDINNGWIPCSDRLPENMQTVLFTSEDGNVDCGWYDADKNWCVNDNYFPNAFRFIAWQPLPEPYKAEEPQWKRAMMNAFLNRNL